MNWWVGGDRLLLSSWLLLNVFEDSEENMCENGERDKRDLNRGVPFCSSEDGGEAA